MKTTVSIYNKTGLVAKAIVKTKKEYNRFVYNNMPSMLMKQRVLEGWAITRS